MSKNRIVWLRELSVLGFRSRGGGEREREIGWESIRPCYRPKLFYDRNSLLVNYFMIGDTFGEMKEMIDDVCLIKFNLESIFFLNLIFEFYF